MNSNRPWSLLRNFVNTQWIARGSVAGLLLLAGACATTPEIDVNELIKQLNTQQETTEEPVPTGPDSPASELPPAPKKTEEAAMAGELTIQPDSVVQVTVREDSALDGSYSVNNISAIQLGYVGPVFLGNMTEKQAAKKIRDVLENRFFNKATVNVRILRPAYDKVAVYGQVANGGVIKIGSGDRISLNDALLRAGNFTASVKGVRVRIVRGGLLSAVAPSVDGEIYDLLDENGNPKVPEIYLWNNDVAYVYTATAGTDKKTPVVEGDKKILVLGEVKRQGIYTFAGSAPCTVMYLIFKMGGLPAYANSEAIRIIRPVEGGSEKEIIVDATKILKDGDPEKDVTLEDGDRVIVPEKKLSLF